MGKFIDLTGQKFGRLTVLEQAGKDKRYKTLWKCKCDCGKEIITSTSSLNAGKTKSCGCLRKEMDLAGRSAKKSFNEYWVCGDDLYFKDDNGNICVINKSDYDIINKFHWYKSTSTGYWYTHLPRSQDKTDRKIELHRLIMGTTEKGTQVKIDHFDRNKDNNRRVNLNIVSASINGVNTKIREDNTTGIIGVSICGNKWQAHIQLNHKQKNLGVFPTKEEAIFSRLKAEKEWFGKFAPQRHLFKEYGIEEINE